MMRFAWAIVLLSAIGGGLVQIRLGQNAVRTGMQHMEAERLKVRRELWDQQLRLGELVSPQQIRLRSRELAVEMTGPEDVLENGKQTVQRAR